MSRKHPVDFLCIGAQKAGTTWLHGRLAALPGFTMPYIKELHYFDRDRRYPSPNDLAVTALRDRIRDRAWRANALGSLGSTLRKGGLREFLWLLRYYTGHYSDTWYLRLMGSLEGITGDITPAYSILDGSDVARIAKLLPEVRIILLLRDPIDRAWSQYRYDSHRAKVEPDLAFEQAQRFIDAPNQRLRSDYLRTLALYEEHFPPERILVGFYDAIAERPRELLQGVLSFLGADTQALQHVKDLHQRTNASPPKDIPAPIREHLVKTYLPALEALSERFGGYATRWWLDACGNPQDPTSTAPRSHLVLSTASRPHQRS